MPAQEQDAQSMLPALKRQEMIDRRRHVAELRGQRLGEVEIAKRLGVHHSTISRDLAAIETEWRTEYLAEITTTKARELAELDLMERDAADQFIKTLSVDWFHARLKVKERRAKLLGLDAPAKVDLDGEILVREYVGVTIEAVTGSARALPSARRSA